MRFRILTFISILFAWATAQTLTAIDDAGQTVVEVITVDPVLATPTTRTIQTLRATRIPNNPGQQGPVAQPAPTIGTPHAPIPYTFTTTDALGRTTEVVSVFTPTFPTGTTTPTLMSGTLLQYSSWLQIVGSNTIPPAQTGGAGVAVGNGLGRGLVQTGVALVGLLGGAWMVLA